MNGSWLINLPQNISDSPISVISTELSSRERGERIREIDPQASLMFRKKPLAPTPNTELLYAYG